MPQNILKCVANFFRLLLFYSFSIFRQSQISPNSSLWGSLQLEQKLWVLSGSNLVFRKPRSPNVTNFGCNGSVPCFGHVCYLRYLKLAVLAFFCVPRLAQNGHFVVFCNQSQKVGSRDPIMYDCVLECAFVLNQGHINYFYMRGYSVRWIGLPIFPKNRRIY